MGNREPRRKNEPATQGSEQVRDARNKPAAGGQKGPQVHAEGQHGSKTHAAFLAQLQSPGVTRKESNAGAPRVDEPVERDGASQTTRAGKHKIWEDREQHDEADKNAEKNRLAKELDRRGAPDELTIDPDTR